MHSRFFGWALALLFACDEGASAPVGAGDAGVMQPPRDTERMSFLRDAALDGQAYEGELRPNPRDAASGSTSDAARPGSGDAATPSADDCGSLARSADSRCGPKPESEPLCARAAARAGLSLRADQAVTWARLLCEAVDLERFTRAPARPERALLASSYNRMATQEGQSGWFANDDHTFFLREQGDERVMMESTGPGVITRLWSPTPSGLLRIYIDDPDVPAFEAPMLDLLSGKLELPWGQPFVFEDARGYSAYLPIPFARYARVATTTTDNLYYQVDYREYPPDTQVESFSREGMRSLAPLVEQLALMLDDPSSLLPPSLAEHSITLGDDAPEQTAALGPVVVRELTILGAPRSEDWLRKTRLVLTVDGERTVDVPVGDLFGGGPGHFPHASLAVTRSDDALTLRWPMPVARELSARLEANGGALGEVTLRLRYTRGIPPDHRLFHARWTGNQPLNTSAPLDWTLLHVRGSGWYVGTVLNVANPSLAWWGEGDEKIFVDGEAFPSHFGTGTEDYFGYGWCSNEPFARPWIGQTRSDGPLSWGRSSLYRWHVADAIAFEEQLRFNLEVLHWSAGVAAVTMVQDAVSYWYAAPGSALEQAALATDSFTVAPVGSGAPPLPRGPYACKLP